MQCIHLYQPAFINTENKEQSSWILFKWDSYGHYLLWKLAMLLTFNHVADNQTWTFMTLLIQILTILLTFLVNILHRNLEINARPLLLVVARVWGTLKIDSYGLSAMIFGMQKVFFFPPCVYNAQISPSGASSSADHLHIGAACNVGLVYYWYENFECRLWAFDSLTKSISGDEQGGNVQYKSSYGGLMEAPQVNYVFPSMF